MSKPLKVEKSNSLRVRESKIPKVYQSKSTKVYYCYRQIVNESYKNGKESSNKRLKVKKFRALNEQTTDYRPYLYFHSKECSFLFEK